MERLLKIEFLKTFKYPSFWILIGLYVFFLALVEMFFVKANIFLDSEGVDLSMLPIYNYPDIWPNLTYIGSFFRIFLAVLVIMMVTNEFEFRTLRQQVINGSSRTDSISAKLIFILILAVFVSFLMGIFVVILEAINGSADSDGNFLNGIKFLGGYFLMVLGYLLMAFTVGFAVKKTGLAMGLWLLYVYMAEPILSNISNTLEPFFPLNAFNRLVPNPFFKYVPVQMEGIQEEILTFQIIGIAIFWIMAIVGGLIYWVNKRNL